MVSSVSNFSTIFSFFLSLLSFRGLQLTKTNYFLKNKKFNLLGAKLQDLKLQTVHSFPFPFPFRP